MQPVAITSSDPEADPNISDCGAPECHADGHDRDCIDGIDFDGQQRQVWLPNPPTSYKFGIDSGTAPILERPRNGPAFLDSHDVPYETARSVKSIPTADIAAKAKGYTVLIECWK